MQEFGMRKQLHPAPTAKRIAAIRALDKRNREMLALRARGWTYQAIAIQFGVSRQRVHQILQQEV